MTDVVLLVPGFAASSLYKRNGKFGVAEKLWLSDLSIIWGGIEHLRNDETGNPVGRQSVLPGGVLDAVYQPFTQLLQRRGVELHTWSYDWRANIVSNGLALLADLQQYRHTTKRINVVAHSMGGLVAMRALAEMDHELALSFPRLITLGCPWHGSYQAVNLLSGQHEISQTVASIYQFGTFRSYRHWREVWGSVAATWPGLFDMVPSVDMILADGVPPGQNPLDAAWWASVNPAVTQGQLTQGQLRNTRRLTLPPGIQHYNWRGVGKVTPGKMPKKLPDGILTEPRELLGDGTVPEFSSLAPEGFNAINSNFLADHAQFTNDVLVQMALRELIGF